MSDNDCCPNLVIVDCSDTDEHKHIACVGSLDDGPGVDNETAMRWCLGNYRDCPQKPKGET